MSAKPGQATGGRPTIDKKSTTQGKDEMSGEQIHA